MNKPNGFKWTQAELDQFQFFNPKESWNSFRIKYLPHRTTKSVIDKAQAIGVKSQYKYRKYSYNKDAWKYLTPESCYWAGFIAADGCISKQTHCNANVFSCFLKSTDAHHLYKLKNYCEYTGPLKLPTRDDRKNSTVQGLAICIGNDWIDDLKNNFNIVHRKTLNLQPPNINNNYLLDCFMQGYIDGDGCLYACQKRSSLLLTTTCASKEFCEWTQDFFIKNFSISVRDTISNFATYGENNHQSRINGLRAAVIIDYYRQFPLPRLQRKWENPLVLSEVNRLKQKYPDKFLTLKIPPQFCP
jgi:hypothetical protein